tara:strand:- start:254 stop:571 length:318 start_codon:yes stop_codon:yes gene_type:complete
MNMNEKDKVREEAKISKKIKSYISQFETAQETQKFLEFSKKRSEYARNVDGAFYNYVKSFIENLSKLAILINANKMYHLHTYKNKILKEKQEIHNLYMKIKDLQI